MIDGREEAPTDSSPGEESRFITFLTLLFVEKDVTTRAVAKMFGVSQSTAARWRRAVVTDDPSDSTVTPLGHHTDVTFVTVESGDSACNGCGGPFEGRRAALYCSNACRQKAYRRRKQGGSGS